MGRPAWMPGEPCWAMDGPSRRAHGAGPERGNLSEAKAVRWGEDFLVPFWSFKIGIGDGHLAAPLPHHPACGSAPGGSRS